VAAEYMMGEKGPSGYIAIVYAYRKVMLEILTAAAPNIAMFWEETPCSHYQSFGIVLQTR
jgi:hypothetical protein